MIVWIILRNTIRPREIFFYISRSINSSHHRFIIRLIIKKFNLCALSFLHKVCFKLLRKLYHWLILHIKFFLQAELSLLNQFSDWLNCNLTWFRFAHEAHSGWINLNLTYSTSFLNVNKRNRSLLLTQNSCQSKVWRPRQRNETFIFYAWL